MDEPFYAVYLSRSGVNHPGSAEVLSSLPRDERTVQDRILSFNENPVLFVKNMAHHMEVLDDPYIGRATHIFLIRDPRRILASYSAVIERPTMRDIGIAWQYRFFRRLQDEGVDPIVVDAAYLLEDPARVLTRLCERCGLPFEQRMVHWPAGPKPYDGVWAPYWYANVHRSTSFETRTSPSPPLPAELISLFEEARSFYEKLLPFSLKA